MIIDGGGDVCVFKILVPIPVDYLHRLACGLAALKPSIVARKHTEIA